MFEKNTLASFLGGGVEENYNYELNKIKKNIADPNTSSKAAREITIKIKFIPNEERQKISTSVSIVSKLAPSVPQETTLQLVSQKGNLEMFENIDVHPGLFDNITNDEKIIPVNFKEEAK